MQDFKDIGLSKPILRAIAAKGYAVPTSIQAKVIKPMLDGRDLLGISQTGTGKTAAFLLPTLHLLASSGKKALQREPRALILAPTRELAGQIDKSIGAYGRELPIRSMAAIGGVSIRPQMQTLKRGVHLLVATPGRLIDLLNQGSASLRSIQVFVLDEADRMLDMGFIHDVRKIAGHLPMERQTALFSATMPKAVRGLAGSLLSTPIQIEVSPPSTVVKKVMQKVLFVPQKEKAKLLIELLYDQKIKSALVFVRTKYTANRISEKIVKSGIRADAIHGNKSQNARQRALDKFQKGKLRVLVATDIASRGIDVKGVTHVINFDLPNEPESYVHRIGRTARAGNNGTAISFCQSNEIHHLKGIEKVIREPIPASSEHHYCGEKSPKSETRTMEFFETGNNKNKNTINKNKNYATKHRRHSRKRKPALTS